jgi:hypothetical protein
MKTQPKVFSISKFNPDFVNIEPIEQGLTLTEAEKLSINLIESSNYSQDYFIYLPDCPLTTDNIPARGHAVNIISGYYTKGRGIIDKMRDREEGKVEIALSPSAYCNPQSILDRDISLSISGGPFPNLSISNLVRQGNVYQRFWYARHGTLSAGCSINYFCEVPFWEYNGIEE